MSAQKLELSKVHIIEKIPGTQQFRMTGVQPAMQVRRGDEVVWIQRGKLFDDGGELLPTPPAWFAEEVKRLNPAVLRECGYQLKV